MQLTRDFFLWCLSSIYIFAFASLYVQIPGLYGNNGILPARLVIQSDVKNIRELFAGQQPSLLRLVHLIGLDLSTGMDFLTLAGVVLSSLALISHRARNCLVFALLWALYFSMYQVGQTFLWFQWDILLLEVGFLAILIAPWNMGGLSHGSYHQHDAITMWLVKWLLFRLMFASGVVKLTSQCPTWWGLTVILYFVLCAALNYHYETQVVEWGVLSKHRVEFWFLFVYKCLPTPAAWYFHQLPEWFHKLSVVIVYVIEILVPFLFFSPIRGQRIFAALCQVILMMLIIVTGNYNFFNLLTCVLCISLIDDDFIMSCMRKTNTEGADKRSVGMRSLFRPLRWTLNVVVYGGLIYWTTRLFSISLHMNPFSISSQIKFSLADLHYFLELAMPVTIWLGAVSLAWCILTAIFRSLYEEKTIVRKAVNIFGSCVFGFAAVGMFSISLVPFSRVGGISRHSLPASALSLYQSLRGYNLTASYGLFRRMTGVGGRPEVIIEGSNYIDKGWKEYNFLHKPGNVSWYPTIVAPHQPRLDWQMWFAALGSYQHNPWFLNLAYRLLSDESEVLELMGQNPFPKKPPKYVRAKLYHYHFTSFTGKKSDWWHRTYKGEYLPILSLTEPTFINYLQQAGIHERVENLSSEPVNLLRTLMLYIRRQLGQPDGFSVCIAAFMSAVCLSFIDRVVTAVQVSR